MGLIHTLDDLRVRHSIVGPSLDEAQTERAGELAPPRADFFENDLPVSAFTAEVF